MRETTFVKLEMIGDVRTVGVTLPVAGCLDQEDILKYLNQLDSTLRTFLKGHQTSPTVKVEENPTIEELVEEEAPEATPRKKATKKKVSKKSTFTKKSTKAAPEKKRRVTKKMIEEILKEMGPMVNAIVQAQLENTMGVGQVQQLGEEEFGKECMAFLKKHGVDDVEAMAELPFEKLESLRDTLVELMPV